MSVEITQADREAAAAQIGHMLDGDGRARLLDGKMDTLSIVQAFAKHRSTSTEEVERLRAALSSIAGETDTVAEFEGMAFRNFAADVLAGRPVTTWTESAWPPRTALGATSHVE